MHFTVSFSSFDGLVLVNFLVSCYSSMNLVFAYESLKTRVITFASLTAEIFVEAEKQDLTCVIFLENKSEFYYWIRRTLHLEKSSRNRRSNTKSDWMVNLYSSLSKLKTHKSKHIVAFLLFQISYEIVKWFSFDFVGPVWLRVGVRK